MRPPCSTSGIAEAFRRKHCNIVYFTLVSAAFPTPHFAQRKSVFISGKTHIPDIADWHPESAVIYVPYACLCGKNTVMACILHAFMRCFGEAISILQNACFTVGIPQFLDASKDAQETLSFAVGMQRHLDENSRNPLISHLFCRCSRG